MNNNSPQINLDYEKKVVMVYTPNDWEVHSVPLNNQRFQSLKLQFLVGEIDKIPAIKKVREMTGWGLREAKDEVDKWKG